ncbi:hypothetical protein KJ807_05680 [Patescibacteria group bacterium]|nr:hypothetical protein [Patescibacteria group bacterium]
MALYLQPKLPMKMLPNVTPETVDKPIYLDDESRRPSYREIKTKKASVNEAFWDEQDRLSWKHNATHLELHDDQKPTAPPATKFDQRLIFVGIVLGVAFLLTRKR